MLLRLSPTLKATLLAAMLTGLCGCSASSPAEPPAESPESETSTPTDAPLPTLTATPSPSPTLTPVPTSTPTLVPLDIPEWGEPLIIEAVCLSATQHFPSEVEAGYELPVIEMLKIVLNGMGIETPENQNDCQAILDVTLHFESLSGQYGSNARVCYNGAQVDGTILLILPAVSPLSIPITRTQYPPDTINENDCDSSPATSPYRVTYRYALLEGLYQIWGLNVFVPALTAEDLEYWFGGSAWAAATIVKLLGREALPITPALIHAYEAHPSEMVFYEALKGVTGQDFGFMSDAEEWREWWYSQQP
nr:hypothetical protein [Anaerolineae bacterium]